MSQAIEQEEFFPSQGRVNICLPFKPSTIWMKLTHIIEGNLLNLVYQFKCKSHWKIPSQKQTEKYLIKYLSTSWPSQVDTYNWPSHFYFLALSYCSL